MMNAQSTWKESELNMRKKDRGWVTIIPYTATVYKSGQHWIHGRLKEQAASDLIELGRGKQNHGQLWYNSHGCTIALDT